MSETPRRGLNLFAPEWEPGQQSEEEGVPETLAYVAQQDTEWAASQLTHEAREQADYDTAAWQITEKLLRRFQPYEAEVILELVKVRFSLRRQLQIREKERPKYVEK